MREILTTKKVTTAIALGLASAALAGCGDKGSEHDKGTDVIGKCPANYAVGAKQVTGSREQFRVKLGGAVSQLAAELPRNGLGEAAVQYTKTNLQEKKAIAAAVEVFHQSDKVEGLDYKLFEVNTPENRVDDLSEQFCAEGQKLYVAPQTATAIGAMQAAGIKLEQ